MALINVSSQSQSNLELILSTISDWLRPIAIIFVSTTMLIIIKWFIKFINGIIKREREHPRRIILEHVLNMTNYSVTDK